MGLDISHDCWHGAYSAFMRWRMAIAEVAGYGSLYDYDGFGGFKSWPKDDVLVSLLFHSDCDGNLKWEICDSLADRLEGLLPALVVKGSGKGHVGSYEEKTKFFIAGLRQAYAAQENVEFH